MTSLFLGQHGITRDFWTITVVRLVAVGHRGLALIQETGKISGLGREKEKFRG